MISVPADLVAALATGKSTPENIEALLRIARRAGSGRGFGHLVSLRVLITVTFRSFQGCWGSCGCAFCWICVSYLVPTAVCDFSKKLAKEPQPFTKKCTSAMASVEAKEQAETFKERGNSAFKDGRFREAVCGWVLGLLRPMFPTVPGIGWLSSLTCPLRVPGCSVFRCHWS